MFLNVTFHSKTECRLGGVGQKEGSMLTMVDTVNTWITERHGLRGKERDELYDFVERKRSTVSQFKTVIFWTSLRPSFSPNRRKD